MAIEVFNRYENKYLIDSFTFFKLIKILDKYNKNGKPYSIINIYYDTKCNLLIRNSLSKPKYKEKLRLRAYGKQTIESKVYIEIKKKFKGLVNKRRSSITLENAYDFIEKKVLNLEEDFMNIQVINEVEYLLSQNTLYPNVYLSYDRYAFFGKEDSNLRISFDTNIRSRSFDLKLESGEYGDLVLDNDTWLMEIKVAKSIPLWLAKLLSENKIYPTSFSKYGKVYENVVSSKNLNFAKNDLLENDYINYKLFNFN